MTKEESFAYYQSCKPEEMFQVKDTTITLPEKAKLFDSYVCDCCGETTGANWVRLWGGKTLCLDCYETYDRFCV
jgi:formylmethanofuran dehydrogenase subunit E